MHLAGHGPPHFLFSFPCPLLHAPHSGPENICLRQTQLSRLHFLFSANTQRKERQTLTGSWPLPDSHLARCLAPRPTLISSGSEHSSQLFCNPGPLSLAQSLDTLPFFPIIHPIRIYCSSPGVCVYVCVPMLEATQGNQVHARPSTGSSNPSRGSIEYMACHVTDDYMQPWGRRKED